jgi:hypothetical protein
LERCPTALAIIRTVTSRGYKSVEWTPAFTRTRADRRGAYSEIKVWRHLLGAIALDRHIGSYTARSLLIHHLSSSSSPRYVSVDVAFKRETTDHLALLGFADGPEGCQNGRKS